MPTDEFKEVLDRDRSIVEAQQLIELCCPVLREVVNHASWALKRCMSTSDNLGGENEDLATFTLYRHLIELIDSVEVLLSHSCVESSIPIMRAAMEATLSIEFIMQTDYTRRSLCWTCGYIHSRMSKHQRMDRTTHAGKEFLQVFERFTPGDPPLQYASAVPIANLKSVLARPEFQPIEHEFARLTAERKTRRQGPPQWYQLFNGPNNRRDLARAIGREAEYLMFYGDWSGFSHAADASPYIRPADESPHGTFLAVRSPQDMAKRAHYAVAMMLRGTRLMVNHFREGEDLSRWYIREVQPAFRTLSTIHVRPRN